MDGDEVSSRDALIRLKLVDLGVLYEERDTREWKRVEEIILKTQVFSAAVGKRNVNRVLSFFFVLSV